jgi:hypothetical protein
MKQFYSCLLAAVLSLIFSQKLHSQTVIDTNLTAYKNIFLSNLGQQTIVLNANSYNPANDSVFFSQSLFTCDDKGDSVTIFITITDTSVTPKNTYFTGSTIIWTIDNTPPVMIVNQSPTVYVAANGIAKLNFANIDQGSWDSCGISLNTFAILTKTNYFCNEIGTQTVLARIADFNGNIASKSLQVTVADTTRPNLNLKPDTLYLGGNPLSAQLTFAKVNNNSTDNCGLGTATLNGQATLTFGCANVGANTITVALNDVNGNTATKTVQVWVLDTLGFSYTKNPKTTYLAGNSASVIGNQLISLNLNGCSVPALTWQSDTTFSCANAASNPNYLTFTLTSGATTLTDSVAITVLDTIAPTLLLKTDTLYMSTGGVAIPFAAINNGSFDNCALDSATVNGASQAMLSCSDTGLQNLNVVLFDIHGNAKTGSIAVYVIDTLTPKYTANNFTAYINGPTVAVSRANILSGLSGGCTGLPTLTFTRDTIFSCTEISTNPNYLTFTLAAGTVSVTDSVAITVLDTLSPTLILKSDTVFLSGSPLAATLHFVMINNGSLDACGLDSATVNGVSQLTFGCADVGPQTISVQLFDVNGNATSGSVSVFVADGIQPTYTATPITAYLNPSQITISRSNFLSNVAGGCAAPIVSVLSDTVFTCTNIQSNPNYIVFSVASGIYQVTDSIAVTVLDTLEPTLTLQSDTLVLTSNGYTLTFADVNNGSADNCALDSALLNGASQILFGCTDTGWHKINVVLYDINSNSTADSVLVYVIDTLQPGYTKTPYTAYLSTGGAATVSRSNILSNVTGGCGSSLSLMLLSDTTFMCADVSLNPYYIRFSITTTGFSVLDSVPVLVLDTLKPTLMLQNITLNLSGNPLQASLPFSAINLGTADNCGIDSISMNGQSLLTFGCADTGSNAIIVLVIDQNGNAASDTIFALVQDTIQPSYTATPITAYLNPSQATVSLSDFLSNVVGGCAAPIVSVLSDTVFTCASIQSNPNYIVFSVASGIYSITDSIAVTVLDTLEPTLTLQSDTLVLTSNGYTLTFADVNNGSADNCALDSALLNGASQILFSCTDTGWHKINVVLYDINSNSTVDSVLVYVIDTLQPGYTKIPYTAYLPTGGAATLSRSNILSNVTGGCGSSLVVTLLSDTTFTCADVSLNPYYIRFSITTTGFSVLDSVPVLVLDTLKPTLMLQNITLNLSGNPLQASLPFSAINLGTADNCGIDSISMNGQSLLTFGCADTGSNAIIVLVIDQNGNAASDTIFALVQDTIGPSYQKSNYTAYLQSDSVAVPFLTLITNTAAGCYPPEVLALSDSIFTCADIVSNPNFLVFSISAAGITILDSIAVTVLDTLKPNVVIPAADTLIMYSTSITLSFADFDLGTTDNCGIATSTLNGNNQITFTCTDVGLHKIMVLVTDVNGNSRLDSVMLFVDDTISPTYTKTPYTAFLNAAGTASVATSNILTNVSAGCSTATSVITLLSDTTFTCADVRPLPHYIQFSATAGSITLFDSVAVFVVDTLPPTFTTKPPQSLHLGANGIRTLTQADLLVLPPADNCGTDSLVFIPSQLTCNNTVGFVPVAIQAWDVNGNQTTKFMFVIAVDTIKPMLTLQPASVALDSVLGTYTLTAQDVVAASSDNCSISNLTITPNQLTCADTGLVTVTVSAFDPSGNVRVRTTTVFVADSIAPAVTMAPSFTKYLDGNGLATIAPNDVQLTPPFDGCGIASQQLSQTLFNCSDVGPNVLNLQVNDNNGNTTVKNLVVFIADTIKPVGITQNAVLNLDSTGQATLLVSDVLVSATDVCGINNNLTTLSKTNFDCSDVGINMVTISIQDVHGNIRQYVVQVEVLGVSAGSFNILGPTQVCGNQFNVRYSIDTVATANDYTWIITNGTIVSRSFKGREVFVHWDKLVGNGTLKVFEATTNGCKLDTAELNVSISGLAPDTTTIRFWNDVSQTTLVVTNTKANYYQWGFDVWNNGIRVSTPLAGETQTSYYNPAIGTNIQTLGYHYWCELSMDGNCWNRSYFQSYPINVPENELSNLHVFPNPFTNTLHIAADSPLQHIKLYDLYGKLLRNQTLNGLKTIELNDLQELPPATYLLQIEFKNGTQTTLKVIRLQ